MKRKDRDMRREPVMDVDKRLRRISRFGVAVIVILLFVFAGVMFLPWPRGERQRVVDGERIAKAMAQYARDVSARGERLRPSVTLDELVRGGYLTEEDAKPLTEGFAKVIFYTDATGTNPQSLLVEAQMTNGDVQAVLADGSVQQFTAARWAEFRRGVGQNGTK